MKKWFLLISLVFSTDCFAGQGVVNVFAWTYYIPSKVIHQFEQQTGIKVNLSEYDSNETLYAKLKATGGYDVIIPSSYYVDRMRQEGMLHKIDHSRLKHLSLYNPDLMRKTFDPHNDYSLPYLYGITGIVVNRRFWHQRHFDSWADFWHKGLKDKLLILNDPREAFAMALLKLGYNPNDTNPAHIQQAFEQLKKLMRNIRMFNSDAEISTYVDEDVTLGMGWSGDIYLAQQENHNLTFIYPKHYTLWIDCLAIPKNAPDLNNAYRFINFLSKPKIAAEISQEQGYASPITQANHLLDTQLRNNIVFNPPHRIIEHAVVQKYLGPAANKLIQHDWQLLKLGAGA